MKCITYSFYPVICCKLNVCQSITHTYILSIGKTATISFKLLQNFLYNLYRLNYQRKKPENNMLKLKIKINKCRRGHCSLVFDDHIFFSKVFAIKLFIFYLISEF